MSTRCYFMIKTTLITMSADGLENIEVERLQTYLSNNNYKSEYIQLNEEKNVEEQFSCIDLESKLFVMHIYSESSVYPKNILKFVNLANKIKSEINDCIIVFGSKFASIYYKEILNDERFLCIDYIILGDGEYTLKALIDCIEKKDNISEFVSKHENIASKVYLSDKKTLSLDINKLPVPDRDFIINKKNLYGNYYAFICESHGCCMKCAFCTRGQFYKWTGRSHESIFNEIKKIRTESAIKCFWFTGGSFEDPGGALGRKKIKDFCNLIIEDDLNVSMRCYLRSNFVSKVNIDLLKLMKRAGFHVALVGIESGNNFDLELYNKGTTVDNNRIALKKLKEAGIYCRFISGLL